MPPHEIQTLQGNTVATTAAIIECISNDVIHHLLGLGTTLRVPAKDEQLLITAGVSSNEAKCTSFLLQRSPPTIQKNTVIQIQCNCTHAALSKLSAL